MYEFRTVGYMLVDRWCAEEPLNLTDEEVREKRKEWAVNASGGALNRKRRQPEKGPDDSEEDRQGREETKKACPSSRRPTSKSNQGVGLSDSPPPLQ